MTKYKTIIGLFIIFVFAIDSRALGQDKSLSEQIPSVTINESNIPSKGYFFISSEKVISSENSNYISIIDNNGIPVFFRSLKSKASDFKVQENGFISYSSNDSIFILDSSFVFTDTITLIPNKINPNDCIIKENNEKIVLVYSYRNQDLSSIFPGGHNNAVIVENNVVIIDEENNSTTIWNSENYFNVEDVNADSPFIDLTNDTVDYIGLVDVVMDTDTTLLLSCQYMDEITKINLNSGDVVWRLGGVNNEFDFINNSIEFSQQSSIDFFNDNLFVYDNGILHDKPVTSIIEYTIDEVLKTIEQINRYCHKDSILVEDKGSIQKRSNGNLVINWGNNAPSITELFENGCEALELDFTNHSYLNNLVKTDWHTNLFTPVVDTINFGMWDYTVYRVLLPVTNNTNSDIKITSTHNFSDGYYVEDELPKTIPANGTGLLTVSFYPETIEIGIIEDWLTLNIDTENDRVSQQVYLIGYRDDFITPTLSTTPFNEQTNVSVNSTVLLDFGEPLRMIDNSEITYQNVKDLLAFKLDNNEGLDVEYDVKLSSEKDYIILKPKKKLQYNTTYYVELKTDLKDYYNLVLPSTNFTFTTEISSGILEIKDSDIEIFPNPVKHSLYIFSKTNIIEEIIIVDVIGRLRYLKSNLSTKDYVINLNGFNDGIYIMNIKFQDGNVLSKRIIKKN